jgi:tetratricopeptide (TPR) repeat protein
MGLMRGGCGLVGLALVVVAVVAPIDALPAQTARELTADADRLAGARDRTPAALQNAIGLYEEAIRLEPDSAELHVKLAEAALDLGDASANGLVWYERGARAAARALELNERAADAHFLLAAHRGQLTKRGSILEIRPSIVGELEEHLRRALALNPRHARALHMMGALLRDTPVVLRVYLKGKRSDVERYLGAAVEANPRFPEARLDLAELYLSTSRPALARAQAQAVLDMAAGSDDRLWREKYRSAAAALLQRLPTP